MDVKQTIQEKVLAEMIAERDAIIVEQHFEIQKLEEKIKALEEEKKDGV